MNPPKRKPTRLKEYDYSHAGAYFVTICTKDRRCIFWNKRRDNPRGCPLPSEVKYSEYGNIANKTVKIVMQKFGVVIDSYIVMPNHVHMIIILEHDPMRTTARVVPTISEVVGAYKSIVALECLKIFKSKGLKMGELWQRSFHDHIIRNERINGKYPNTWKTTLQNGKNIGFSRNNQNKQNSMRFNEAHAICYA